MKINGNPDGGGGASAVIEGLSVTSNGTYTAGGGVDGYSPVEVNVPSPEFVTETLSVSVNNTYYPGQGVNGFSQVVVDVPQSVSGITEKGYTEHDFHFVNLNNSASYVYKEKFFDETELRTVNLPNCKVVQASAFQNCQYLSEVSLPVCEVLGENAFNNTGLRTVYLPACYSISVGVIRYCQSLTEVNMPELVSVVGGSAFQDCSSLVSVSFEKLSSTGYAMFSGCRSLKDVYMPNVRFIEPFGFNWCISLESVDFLPKCLYLNSMAFANCSKISYVNLPECLYLSASAFDGCSSLTHVDLPLCTTLYQYVFNRCPSLVSVSLPLCTYMASFTLGTDKNITELDFPMMYNMYGYNCSYNKITRVNMPVISYMGEQDYNRNPAPLLSEVSFGNMVYQVPQYQKFFAALSSNGGSIYIDAAMWDKWLSASGWSSLSAAFVSFGDVNEPMLSFSDGTVYGKTWALYDYFWGSSGISVASDSVITIDLSQCRYADLITTHRVTSINLPECKVFHGVSAVYHLETVNLPKCEVIETTTFVYDCGPSVSMYIGSGLSTVCKLWPGSRYYSGNITIDSRAKFYVPSSLVDAYKSAPYWSRYSSQIFPIE